jgi:hypothetical protein
MRFFPQSGLCAAVVAFCVSVSPLPAHADIQTIQNSNSAIWGAVGTGFFNYKEPSSPPDIPDSEHGWNPSLAAGLSYMNNSNWYSAFEGNVAFGDDKYNGSTYDSNTGYYDIPYLGTTHETITNIDGKFGKGFSLGNSIMLTPYGELGFRYWDRNLGAGQVEDYQNFDVLGGLMLQIAPTNRLILTGYGSAGTTFAGRMKTDGLDNNLGDASMYKIGGKVGYDLTQRVELFTTLDFDHFHYVKSPWQYDANLGGYIMEPTSFTDDTTMRVGLAYHFK